ncbi:MAG TPA: BolA family protein [Candidatus Nanoarchaeia archaeon]|nr:BolA family protein [Candidatus Nanoarchaeia archaeon]
MLNRIKQKLEAAFPRAKVQIADTSAGHETHNSSGAHLAVLIIYKGFAGKSLVEQHQLVYAALKEEMREQVHALKIKTRSE